MGRPRAPVLTLAAAALLAACAPGTPPAPPPAPVSVGPLVRPGVPLELAEHRAATISNVAYDLALDFTGHEEWINGAVSIIFDRAAGASHLVLDFRGLAVPELYVNQERVPDAAMVNQHVVIPERYLVEGRNIVDVRFMAAAAPSGASVIEFSEADAGGASAGESDVYHYTLLVPADASLLFPSFDQPDLKATFRLELITPVGTRVVSNTPVADQVETDLGLWTRFEPTRPISTYLAAFAVGPWATWSDSSGPVPMTLYARRSRASEVDADTLLATNRRALEWLEDYFGIPYPFGKLDYVLAPAFPFGGMEHPGAIFYNESRFVFREPPTLNQRLARDATIYHEIAHQWFGDLVTMRWFDDLWLKEGFATYMSARMQAALNPETAPWQTFYLQNKPPAYRVDATSGTTPVWQSLPNLDLAKSNYGPIVYNKAPSILKQLQFLVGEEAFRSALQRLLRRYAYANFTWRDLLAEMQAASGVELGAFGAQYILRGGVPLVETRLTTRDGLIEDLRLVQRPAVDLADTVAGWWPGRVQLRLGYAGGEDQLLTVTFTGDTTLVGEAIGRPAPDYVFPNDGDYGYGIFLLDEASTEHLRQRVGELEDPLLRTLVWGALWDGVREGRIEPRDFAEAALRELPAERDEQLAAFLLSRTATAVRRYLADADGGEIHPLRAEFERLLLAGIDDASASYDLRKERLDLLLAVARTPESLRRIEDLLAGRSDFDGSPLAQPSRWAAVRTLVALGHPDADSILAAERDRDATPEGERQAFIAGAARATAASKAEYFARFLDDPELNEEWVTASLGAFNHPAHQSLTLPLLEEALQRLPWIRENRRIFFLPQWIEGFIGGQDSREALAVVDGYLAASPDLPEDIRRKVLQSRDELARTVRIREGASSERSNASG